MGTWPHRSCRGVGRSAHGPVTGDAISDGSGHLRAAGELVAEGGEPLNGRAVRGGGSRASCG